MNNGAESDQYLRPLAFMDKSTWLFIYKFYMSAHVLLNLLNELILKYGVISLQEAMSC